MRIAAAAGGASAFRQPARRMPRFVASHAQHHVAGQVFVRWRRYPNRAPPLCAASTGLRLSESQPILRVTPQFVDAGIIRESLACGRCQQFERLSPALITSMDVVRKSGPSQSGSAYSIYGFASVARSREVVVFRANETTRNRLAISTLWTCSPRFRRAASSLRPASGAGKTMKRAGARSPRPAIAGRDAWRSRCPPSGRRRRADRK